MYLTYRTNISLVLVKDAQYELQENSIQYLNRFLANFRS